jgi:uridylate kinase
MQSKPKYKRVLLKISGESLCPAGAPVVDAGAISALVEEIKPVVDMGVQIALVVGGGNIIRGKMLAENVAIQRATADYMGMMATIINALALQDCLGAAGIPATMMSAIPMTSLCEEWNRINALSLLESGRMVVLAGGTGSPFFTTDTCAALRAGEIGAEVLLKATKVDGVFDSDPVKNPAAKKYDKLTYQKVLAETLGVMDLTAVSLCMANKIPIIVFKLSTPGNLAGVIQGKNIGTVIT